MSSISAYLGVILVLVLTGPGQVLAVAEEDGPAAVRTESEVFLLSAIHFNKLSFLAGPEFYRLYTPYLGTRVNVAKLKEICQTITRVYQEKGFMAAECILPPQTVRHGIVEMYLFEGIVGRVSLTGTAGADDDLLLTYVNRIPLNRPLAREQVKQVQNWLAAIPGIEVRVYTRPLDDVEKLELVFDVEQTSFAAEAYINNRGSKVVGPVQAGVILTANSLFHAHENIEVHVFRTQQADELEYLELDSVWPVGLEGSSILFGASSAESKPGDILSVLDIDVRMSGARLGWSRLLTLTNSSITAFASTLEYFRSDSSTGGVRYEYNELYKIKLAVSSKTEHASSYTETDFSLVHGLPGLNTTTTAASGGGSTGQEKFDALRFDLYYSSALLNNMLFSFQAQGQYGSSTMPVSEYIAFGGEVMGSAYDPAEFFGNHGLGGKVRLAYRLANSWLPSGYTLLYAQNDVVKVWYEGAGLISSGASLAAGVILRSGSVYIDLQAAKPLTRPVLLEASNDLRYFGSVRYFF